MLYLNNPLLTSDKIISYFKDNLDTLKKVPVQGSKEPSKLSQLKSTLKTNFFYDLVGCDLALLSVPPGIIDLKMLPQDTPLLIKQEHKYFIYGASKGKDLILTELSSHAVHQANLDFPGVGVDAQPLPYNMHYKTIYDDIAAKNEQKMAGCDLVLKSVSPGNIDVTAFPKTTPMLIKQGDTCFIYGRTDGKNWGLRELSSHVIDAATLNFPVVGADDVTILSYNTQYKSMYEEMALQNPKIPLDKTTELKINLNKRPTDEEILNVLKADDRFTSNYPKLKQVLNTIFNTSDFNDKSEALKQLNAISDVDWSMEKTRTQFDDFNAKHGYFEGSANQVELFNKLAEACRSMIVLFEKNNTQDDTLAYDYAYKLMVLFLDPNSKDDTKKLFDVISKETNLMLTNSDGDKAHPFHDALLVKLSGLPNASKLTDKAGWRKFVKENGVKSFYFLEMAEKIEEKISQQYGERDRRAPITMDEANKIAALCRYTYSRLDPNFAELCHQYKVPEDRFNACIYYLHQNSWPMKYGDSIPNIQITGRNAAEGFSWVKLPVRDKRALILGDITDCCQSIAGHSEQCVKDAVSLDDNGLYVLLKRRSGGSNAEPMIYGEINYKNFQIVGQSYVWKSKRGNICLDSIECLKDVISDSALQSITSDFATQLLQDNPDIKYVTVGRGGKTPEALFDNAVIPEKNESGFCLW